MDAAAGRCGGGLRAGSSAAADGARYPGGGDGPACLGPGGRQAAAGTSGGVGAGKGATAAAGCDGSGSRHGGGAGAGCAVVRTAAGSGRRAAASRGTYAGGCVFTPAERQDLPADGARGRAQAAAGGVLWRGAGLRQSLRGAGGAGDAAHADGAAFGWRALCGLYGGVPRNAAVRAGDARAHLGDGHQCAGRHLQSVRVLLGEPPTGRRRPARAVGPTIYRKRGHGGQRGVGRRGCWAADALGWTQLGEPAQGQRGTCSRVVLLALGQ